MSIAFLDPGNIESDLQAGAVAGFKVIEWGHCAEAGDQAKWVETPACHISPEWPAWLVLLGDVKFKWARKESPGQPCQNVGCMGWEGDWSFCSISPTLSPRSILG